MNIFVKFQVCILQTDWAQMVAQPNGFKSNVQYIYIKIKLRRNSFWDLNRKKIVAFACKHNTAFLLIFSTRYSIDIAISVLGTYMYLQFKTEVFAKR